MSIKRITIILLSVLLTFSLISCNSDSESETETAKTEATKETEPESTENNQKNTTEEAAASLSDYKIISPSPDAQTSASADKLATYFSERINTTIEVLDNSTGYDGPAIIFGAKDRSGIQDESLEEFSYTIRRNGDDIIINCSGKTAVLALNYLTETIKKADDIKLINDYDGNMIDSLDDKLELQSETKTEISEGITRYDAIYKSKNGTTTKTYRIEIAAGMAAPFIGTANDNNDALGKQSVLDQAQLYNDMGRDVVCAINADFFGDGGEPCGILIRNGEKQHNLRGSCFFGVLKTGEYVCGDAERFKTFDKDAFLYACGASQWILTEGEFKPIESISTMSKRDPRSTIGIKDDGSIVIMAIDGRGSSGSTGVTIYNLATLMAGYGCKEAVNLDGGGSTQLIIKNPESGALEVVNSPSEMPYRQVSNTIIVAK